MVGKRDVVDVEVVRLQPEADLDIPLDARRAAVHILLQAISAPNRTQKEALEALTRRA
jgi:hypothetical protein